MNARIFSFMLAITAFPSTPDFAFAETLDAQQKALNLITDTADKICNVVSARGEANSSEVKGNVTAQLRGLVSRLADLGVWGTGSLTSEQYEGVLRSDLAGTLKDNASCKLKVFETLQTKFLASEHPSEINITGTWRDTSDPSSQARVTQHGEQFEFTKTGRLLNGIRYEMSGTGTLWGSTFTSEYRARYDNGASSTGYCQGAAPRDGFETATCKDTLLGVYNASMVRE